jgi:Tfp pilus assembly protein PilF
MRERMHWVMTLAILTAACGGTERAAQKYLTSGDRYIGVQRYDAAIIEYRNAVKRRPEWAEAERKLADAYFAAGSREQAFNAYERATAIDPGDLQARFGSVRVLLGTGDFDAARVRAEAILDRDPENVDAQALVYQADAESKAMHGEDAGAEESFRHALATAPRSIEARVAFARFLGNQRRFGEAQRQLDEALASDHTSELANRTMAWLMMAMDRWRDAEWYLKTAAQASPQRYGSTLALVDYYTGERRYADAKTVLTSMPKPLPLAARVRLAAVAFDTNDRKEARRLLDPLLKKNQTAEAFVLQARMLAADGKRTEAQQAVQTALQLNPSLAAAHYVAGEIALDDNRFETVEQELREALRFDGGNPRMLVMLARVELALDKPDLALEAAQQAGSRPEARVLAAQARAALGDVQPARADLTALAKDPAASHDAALALASIEIDAGLLDSARTRLRALRAETPADARVLVADARAARAAGDAAGAVMSLEQAAAAAPSWFDPVAMLADIRAESGDYEQARKLLADFEQRVPTSSVAPTAVGMVLEAERNQDGAREAYERALRIDPRSRVAAENLARIRSAAVPAP